jgi:hypothetical protein
MLRSKSGVLLPSHFEGLLAPAATAPAESVAEEAVTASAVGGDGIDYAGLARSVLEGDTPWTEALQFKGEYRKRLLRELFAHHVAETGDDSYDALAARLRTTSENLRQICSKAKVYPRDGRRTGSKDQ